MIGALRRLRATGDGSAPSPGSPTRTPARWGGSGAPRSRRPARWPIIASIVSTAVGVFAQTLPPQFRAGVDLVQIDVSVLDRDRQPVHGLTAKDFTLVVDGQPRDVVACSEVNVPDAAEGAAWTRHVAPDVRTNTAEGGRLFAFLIDDLSAPIGLSAKTYAMAVRGIVGRMIDALGPTDMAAMIFPGGQKYAQDFTNNHELLRAAIARFDPKTESLNGLLMSRRRSIGTTDSLMTYLADLPARRKSLIYVTPQLERVPAPGAISSRIQTPRLEDALFLQYVESAFDQAMRAKVTIYIVNPMRSAFPDPSTSASRLPRPVTEPSPMFNAPSKTLPAETGGFLIGRPDEIKSGIEQIFRETGSYYLIGFLNPTPGKTGRHSIGVQVNGDDRFVRARTGYFDLKPPKPSKPGSVLVDALAGILPRPNLPLRITAAPFAISGSSDANVAVVLGMREPVLPGRPPGKIDVQVRAFTTRGKGRGITEHHLDLDFAAANGESASLDVLSKLRLKPGAYELRVSARSAALDETGSAYLDLEVPDFRNAPMSISGIVLGVSPGPTAAPRDELSAFLPMAPTTERAFGAGDTVSAFARVYQGGKKPTTPAQLAVRLVDQTDAIVFEKKDALQFDTSRAADVRFVVPTGALVPGRYLLVVEATAGATKALRSVPFDRRTP